MQRRRGFTLIELLIVIVVGSVLAVVSVQFISRSLQGSQDTAERQQLSASAQLLNERVSRALRQSIPGSVRVTSDGRCIEYLPLLAATRYTQLDVAQPIASFQAVPVSATDSVTGYWVVYPWANLASLYTLSNSGVVSSQPVTLAAGSTEVTVALGAVHTFPAHSPTQRAFISGSPEAICQQGPFVYQYRDYGFVTNINNLPAALPATEAAGRSVIGYPLSLNSVQFRVEPPTLQRNGLVSMSWRMGTSTGLSLPFAQEVQIRNVP